MARPGLHRARTACRAVATASSAPCGPSRTRPAAIRPHERTHAGPKEGRLRLLRATRTHVEPIFLLYEGALAGPAGGPTSTSSWTACAAGSGGSRTATPPPELAAASLLIADGHHRYETALAFHEEDGTEASAWLLAVDRADRAGRADDLPDPPDRPADAAAAAARAGAERRRSPVRQRSTREAAPAILRRGARASSTPSSSPGSRPDVRYTPSAEEARAAVDRRRGRGRVPASRAHRRAGRRGRRGGPDDAAEEHVLLSPSSPPACCSCRLTDWLALCRAAVEDVRGVLAELPARSDREPVVGTGDGRRRHDRDRRRGRAGGRRALRRRRRRLHARLRGARHRRGDGSGTWVVLDPIDGSINAKRGLPFFSLSIAVAEGGDDGRRRLRLRLRLRQRPRSGPPSAAAARA